ncbi:VOC family protein [Verrucomicrobiota bacterium sgz303538]
MNITALDHLVLTVRDVDATCRFYEAVMNIETITFGAGRHALRFGQQKINLHTAGAEFSPHAVQPSPGSADLCFLTDEPIENVVKHLRTKGVKIIEGPVNHTGAVSSLRWVYFRDPDGNLIEVANAV